MNTLAAVAIGVAAASVVLAAATPANVALPIRHVDRDALAWVVPSWSLRRWEVVRVVVVGLTAAVSVPLGLWPAVILAPVVPSLLLRWRLGRLRAVAATHSLDVLRASSAALRSGLPLAQALRLAIERGDRLAREPFERALASFDLHARLDEALLGARLDVADRRVSFALEALALVAAEQLPTARAAALIASAADRLAFEQRLADEVRARTSGVRAQIVLLALLVPALAGYLVLTLPGLAATLATPLGSYVLLPAAALLEIAGIVASRRIVRGL